MSSGKVYNIALIGAGNIAPVHAKSITASKKAHLAVVCDIDESKARKLAGEYDTEWCTDYHPLLSRSDIDVFEVVTYSGTHADIGIEAANAGKHVIVTKPMDVTLEKIDALIEACRRNGVKLGATHQFRSYASYRAARQAVESGQLGRLVCCNAYVPWYRSMDYYTSADWRGTYSLDGGGAMMNQSVHYADLIVWLCGPVAGIKSYAATQTHVIEVEDLAVSALKFQNGALGLLLGSTCTVPGKPARLELYGENGSIILDSDAIKEWNLDVPNPTETTGERADASSDPTVGLMDEWITAHIEQIEDVLAAADENREPVLNGAEARRAVELVLAIYKASDTGEEVTLPL